MKCFEHFFEPSPNELAVFKLVAKFLQESNLKRIGIFMSNITVITLNKFRKRARGLLHTRISSPTVIHCTGTYCTVAEGKKAKNKKQTNKQKNSSKKLLEIHVRNKLLARLRNLFSVITVILLINMLIPLNSILVRILLPI